MVPMTEACAECTQNCHVMHKRDKNPSSVATTFFKVMFGDDYSKVLFLPPRFARSVRNMVGKETRLEDSNGEKWTVKFTRVNGLLAFKEGWSKFSLDHGLKVGDFLVFHYIMESHFVVLMYGSSGCPEIRHFGFTQHHKKITRKKGKFIADDHIPSDVNTNGHRLSHDSSSQSERSVYGANERPEIRRSGGTGHKKKRIKTDTMMPPNVNTTSAHHRSLASSSRPGPSVSDKETSQRSEPLVTKTTPDNMVSETPKTVKPFCLVSRDTENVEDEYRRSCLHDVSIPEIHRDESDDGPENDVAVKGGEDDTQNNKSGKVLETRFEESTEKLKESPVMPIEATCNNSIKKRLRSANPSTKKTEKGKKELVGTSDKDDVVKAFQAARPNVAKKEPIWASNNMNLNAGCELKDSKTGCCNSLEKEHGDILPTVKPEPVDYDEALPSGASNTSFSAVMSSYQYLELPKWVKLKSKVILLRNGADLWAVLCRNELGLKALTQGWEAFARERGVLPGDECELVLEREADGERPCSMFRVNITRK